LLGVHLFQDVRLGFRKILESQSIEHLYVSTGWFMHSYMLTMNKMKGKPCYWGDTLDQKIDFSAIEDVAKCIAIAITDPDRTDHLRLRSDELTTREILEIYKEVRGKTIEPVKMGSIQDLQKHVEEFKKKGHFKHVDSINKELQTPFVFHAVTIGYQMFYYTGVGKMDKVDNDQFPMIKPCSFEEFLKSHHGMKFTNE